MPTANLRLVASGAAGVVLVSKEPLRSSFIVQNVDAAVIVCIYTKPGKEFEGIYLYPQTWMQFEKEDAADERWYVVGVAAGVTNLHVLEFFTEKKIVRKWW